MEQFLLPQVPMGAPIMQDHFSLASATNSLSSQMKTETSQYWNPGPLFALIYILSMVSSFFPIVQTAPVDLGCPHLYLQALLVPHLQTHILHYFFLRAGLIQVLSWCMEKEYSSYSRTRNMLGKANNVLGPGPQAAMVISPKKTVYLVSDVLQISSVPLCNIVWLAS